MRKTSILTAISNQAYLLNTSRIAIVYQAEGVIVGLLIERREHGIVHAGAAASIAHMVCHHVDHQMHASRVKCT